MQHQPRKKLGPITRFQPPPPPPDYSTVEVFEAELPDILKTPIRVVTPDLKPNTIDLPLDVLRIIFSYGGAWCLTCKAFYTSPRPEMWNGFNKHEVNMWCRELKVDAKVNFSMMIIHVPLWNESIVCSTAITAKIEVLSEKIVNVKNNQGVYININREQLFDEMTSTCNIARILSIVTNQSDDILLGRGIHADRIYVDEYKKRMNQSANYLFNVPVMMCDFLHAVYYWPPNNLLSVRKRVLEKGLNSSCNKAAMDMIEMIYNNFLKETNTK